MRWKYFADNNVVFTEVTKINDFFWSLSFSCAHTPTWTVSWAGTLSVSDFPIISPQIALYAAAPAPAPAYLGGRWVRRRGRKGHLWFTLICRQSLWGLRRQKIDPPPPHPSFHSTALQKQEPSNHTISPQRPKPNSQINRFTVSNISSTHSGFYTPVLDNKSSWSQLQFVVRVTVYKSCDEVWVS